MQYSPEKSKLLASLASSSSSGSEGAFQEHLERHEHLQIRDRQNQELLDIQNQLEQPSTRSSASREVQSQLYEENLKKKELEEHRARQEHQRVQIEKNMAQLKSTSNDLADKLKSLDQDASGVEIEAECELLNMTHIYGSTMPSFLHEDYSTRLDMMQKINASIEESLHRIAKLTVERVDKSNLPQREKDNLE